MIRINTKKRLKLRDEECEKKRLFRIFCINNFSNIKVSSKNYAISNFGTQKFNLSSFGSKIFFKSIFGIEIFAMSNFDTEKFVPVILVVTTILLLVTMIAKFWYNKFC